MLPVDVEGAGPHLVLVHGFTQTGRSWGPFGAALAERHQVVTVDAPGHGRSAGVTVDMAEGARLLAAAGGPAFYLGYSMGGRLCLHLAVDDPSSVHALVLIGATAGIEDADGRRERRQRDEALAVELEQLGVEAFVRRWLTRPLFAGLDTTTAGFGARLENTVAGLASSLRLAGTGAQESLWPRLPELTMPVLAVVGEGDVAFRARAEAMVEAIGDNAALAVIPGAGHAAHLEAPGATAGAVERFLADWR
ncbi:MAG: alpha/beta fold hydrolase [Acidimicrobiales bacterium]